MKTFNEAVQCIIGPLMIAPGRPEFQAAFRAFMESYPFQPEIHANKSIQISLKLHAQSMLLQHMRDPDRIQANTAAMFALFLSYGIAIGIEMERAESDKAPEVPGKVLH